MASINTLALQHQNAWLIAISECEQELDPKTVAEIKPFTQPRDLLDYIKQRQNKEHRSKIRQLLSKVSSFGFRFEKYQSALDLIAQGTPMPGCLIWGSIRLALKMFENYNSAYERLLVALIMMGDRLSVVELHASVWCDSDEFKGYLISFYKSMIDFWSRVLKFYQRNRLLILFRSFLSGYDLEFKKFEDRMDVSHRILKASANTLQAGEVRTQGNKLQALLQSDQKNEASSLLRWLSPEHFEIGEYENELKSARDLRYADTCEWMTRMQQFKTWSEANSQPQQNLLWISAGPGAGKTIMSSYIVDHLSSKPDFGAVLFFMFNYVYLERCTHVAAACSLTYQLLRSQPSGNDKLYQDLVEHKHASGQDRARNFNSLWSIFSKHVNMGLKRAIVIDALDVCLDAEAFVFGLKGVSANGGARIIVLSRPELEVNRQLEKSLRIQFGARENQNDMATFINRRLSESWKLSKSDLANKFAQIFGVELPRFLLTRSEGSFLWVKLLLEEAETKLTVTEMVDTIGQTPTGIVNLYSSVLKRYADECDKSTVSIYRTVLRWITCVPRPLSVEEVLEILKLQYTGSASNTKYDEEFFLSREAMVSLCGSLVVHENQTL
ncbi:MAG: hypothetical protein Q9191_005572 [Dirinaria sp. TL-2023a]